MAYDNVTAANPYAAALQAAFGTAAIIGGAIKAGKAKKEAAQLERTRPQYSISPYVGQDVSLAESDLANGMSAEATTAYQQGLDRSAASAYDSILKNGGSLNNIGAIYDQSAQGQQRLAIMKDQFRANAINNVVRAHQQAQEAQDKAWALNVYDPYQNKVAANAQARQQATQMIWGGANSVGAGAMNFTQSQVGQNILGKYFNVNQGTGFSGNYQPTFTPQTNAVQSYPMISPNTVSRGAGLTPITTGNSFDYTDPNSFNY